MMLTRRRFKINTKNPLPPPDTHEYVQLARGYVREILEVYDKWDGKETIPSKLRDLMMILRIEFDRRYHDGEK